MSGARSHHYYNATAPSLLSFVLITVVCQIAACGLGCVPPPPDLPEICHNYTPSALSSGVTMETPTVTMRREDLREGDLYFPSAVSD